jgi:Rrf2 family transcriptional regulator, iron-sulfur cluster assembly transcription factor
MILNKTTEYALTVLGYMATSQEELFSAEFLHEKLDIPRSYLRRLLTELSKLGFIRSAKGRKGGFVFARPLEEINLAIIIQMVERAEVMESCLLGHQKCNEQEPCMMHETWLEAKSKMIETLSKTTLQELRERSAARILQH